ncbi:MAG: alpha-galactosidase [Bacteroidetes bacterium]|nr:alpha-galactosidase [Bacteroidota bacterium]
MNKLHLLALAIFPFFALAQKPTLLQKLTQLPDYQFFTPADPNSDWLIHPITTPTTVLKDGEKDLVLTNGLLLRRWRIVPDVTTTHLTIFTKNENYLRGVKPEAELVMDGDTMRIGGLLGQPEYGYLLPEWLDSLHADSSAFHCVDFEIGEVEPLLAWKQNRWSGEKDYPPRGKRLSFFYQNDAEKWHGVTVVVHYEMYDGIPVLCKWLSVKIDGHPDLKINRFTSEILAVREEESSVDHAEGLLTPNLLVQTDYAFHDMSSRFSNQCVRWLPDPEYTSQVNYQRLTPNLLTVSPPLGPGVTLSPGDEWQSFRTWEMPFDSYDRERKGLAERRFYRAIAPWATENSIFMHLTSTDPVEVKSAIDQCAEVGFEMVILSFGSGLDMEDVSNANIQKFKELANYAHSKGIQLGGYSLFSSRHIDDENDVINPVTGQPGGAIFGNAPCLGSQWGIRYLDNLRKFITKTGFDLLEHDGPYPGDVCASQKHPGHEGLEDSQWQQWDSTVEFYKWLRETGVYLNAPDWYFLNGGSKTGIGYRETNWSLPRERQIILGRQNIYDGTWTKTPSMGWTFTPLTEYHGGGAAATLEPLDSHRAAYRQHLWQNFGSGVQSCYRGPRLFDTDETKWVVQAAVNWYKKYRDILNSDIIHLRRPDGQDWDGILHVNPNLKEKGLAMLYNPLKNSILRKIRLPLYYTGLTEVAQVRMGSSADISSKESLPKEFTLNRFFEIEIEVEIPAEGWVWVVIE